MSEAWEALSTDNSNVTGYSPLGCTTSMFANRISFAFDLRGRVNIKYKQWSGIL